PRIANEAAVFGDSSTFPLWEAAQRLGVVISVLADLAHAPTIGTLAERFPEVPIVIDHLGHPDPSRGAADPPFRELLALARHPRVLVKLSGFYHFSQQQFPFEDCWPHIRAAYEHFGPRRLLWGSDYPHVEATCGYAQALLLPAVALADWPGEERALVMG